MNAFKMQGAVIMAAIAGCIFQSWAVFLIVVVVLIIAGIHSGEIRGDPRRR
jgi:hypothetical protein